MDDVESGDSCPYPLAISSPGTATSTAPLSRNRRDTPPSFCKSPVETLDVDRKDFGEDVFDKRREAEFTGLAKVESSVVDRRDLSLADISMMRLEGCRAHSRTPSHSPGASFPRLAASVRETPSDADRPIATYRGGRHPSFAGDMERQHNAVGRLSPPRNDLETSRAMLHRMARDTALTSGKAPGQLPLERCAPSRSASSLALLLTQQQSSTADTSSTREMATSSTSTKGTMEKPSSLHDEDARREVRSLHVSPLCSFSESELRGAVPRSASLARLYVLGGGSAPSAASSPAGPAVCDGDGDGGGGNAPFLGTTVDTSVYNHDFQHILPCEVKEAITRNMRHFTEEEDDEEEMLLHQGVSTKPLREVCVSRSTAEVAVTPRARPQGRPSPPEVAPQIHHDPSSSALPSMGSEGVGSVSTANLAFPSVGAGVAVPFQTWKFPSLGKTPLTQSPTIGSSHRRFSAAEEAAPQRVSIMSGMLPRQSYRYGSGATAKGSHGVERSAVISTTTLSQVAGRRAAASSLPSCPARGKMEASDGEVGPSRFPRTDGSASIAAERRASVRSEHGATAAMPTYLMDTAYQRTMEMVYAAYERQLLRKEPYLRGKRASGVLGRTTDLVPPFLDGAGRGRSPSLSISAGVLGRSAGYYSYGNRVSLSHPNRQEMPSQYLGSMRSVHASPSLRTPGGTPMVRSPAITDLVTGTLRGDGTPSAQTTAAATPSATSQSAPASVAPGTAPAPRRQLDPAVVQRIEGRPLLQTTLFLQYNMRFLQDVRYDAGTEGCGVGRSVALLPDGAATEAPTIQGTALRGDAACTSEDHSPLTLTATNATAVYDEDTCAAKTRVPSPCLEKSLSKRSGLSSLSVDQLSTPNIGAAVRRQTAQFTDSKDAFPLPPLESSAGTSPQRFYRALTGADELTRHVHSVDGIEREVDNSNHDLVVYVGMHLMGWLEVVSLLGCGSFGQVFLCKDLRISDGHFVRPSEIPGDDYEYWNCCHAYLPFSDVEAVPTHSPLVAVKVVKSVPLLEQQSVLEAEMLVLIGAQTAKMEEEEEAGAANTPFSRDPPAEDARCRHVAKVLADGICYGHHCIVMERYGANLHECIAAKNHTGLPMYHIRSIGEQLLSALSLVHEECHIIHADIKPENMLLTMDSFQSAVPNQRMRRAGGSPSGDDDLARGASPSHRCIDSIGDMGSPPGEGSCIELGGAQRARRTRLVGAEGPGNPGEEGTKGQSFRHLRSTSHNAVTLVELSSVPAPEPRRMQTLNRPPTSRMKSSVPLPTATGTGGPGHLAGVKRRPSGELDETAGNGDGEVLPPPQLRIKLIDFSSSCYDGGPFYEYIQSRYYRAPEVIVGAPYSAAIDIWSTGCLLAELLLGMPLLPGCNDHHQLSLIEEVVGPIPSTVLTSGINTLRYYSDRTADAAVPCSLAAGAGAPEERHFGLLTPDEFFTQSGQSPVKYTRYFTYNTLQELVRHCPLTLEERRMGCGLPPYTASSDGVNLPADATPCASVRSEMLKQRFLLYDLLRRLLSTEPRDRPTASRALTHPFFTAFPPYMKTFSL